MSRSQLWSTAVIMLALVVLTTTGQSRREAKEELDKGLQRMAKGNFDGAIESFTRAIELGSHREAQGQSGESGKLNLTKTDNASTSEAIAFIDPLTSVAAGPERRSEWRTRRLRPRNRDQSRVG
jgi:hypothetical protein